jgi:hypothetical protein
MISMLEVGATANRDACAQANRGQGVFSANLALAMTLLLAAIRPIFQAYHVTSYEGAKG